MNADPPASSLGDPNPLPPTPKQTPVEAVFPSPVFATTPRLGFPDHEQLPPAASSTPRFAEEYSVFNATPGNLSGSPGVSGRFSHFAPFEHPSGHKRLLSADSTTSVDLPPPHARQFTSSAAGYTSFHPAHLDPPATSSLPSSTPRGEASQRGPLASPDHPLPADAADHQSLPGSSQGIPHTQTATPPPTARRERHKFVSDLNMQHDGQDMGQPDFTGAAPPQDLTGLLGSPSDLFSYPMSAPVSAPENFWDPASMTLPMDMDFGAAANMFQPDASGHHRQSGSFDWNNEVNMFQDLQPHQPEQPIPAARPAKNQPRAKRTRTLAPKPLSPVRVSAAPMTSSMSMGSLPNTNGPMNNGMMDQGANVVDPGILFGRPQTAGPGADSFGAIDDEGSAEAALAESTRAGSSAGGVRRSASVRTSKTTRVPDRAFASSPLKSSARPGLSRSQSERKPFGRAGLVVNSATQRPVITTRNLGGGVDLSRPPARSSGAVSPVKRQNPLSGLASIPESASRPGSRASVKFYIGTDGRAHAEASQGASDSDRASSRAGRLTGSRSSVDVQQWDDEDDSSTDDEPIIIPSRNSSFNTSFALPDPRRPVGSIFHPSRRSISDRSTTSTIEATSDSQNIAPLDPESDAETVMDDGGAGKHGPDAARELLKVRENRQQNAGQLSSSKSRRFFNMSGRSLHGSSISPTRPGTGTTTDEPSVRCVCHRTEMVGFLVQCESCELWQHGQCVSQSSQPRVYICAFCANTPNMRGGGYRDTRRGNGSLDLGVASSPLASKSFRTLR